MPTSRHDGMVMIVEDDADTREALSEALAHLGYRAVTATNGKEALALLRALDARVPCIIVLDLMMPEMDGWEFRAELQTDPALASIPIVIVTADLTAGDRAAIAGAAFIPKPVDLSTLTRTLERFC